MKKRLITSALPYVNNIPHLGNLIQVLSADVFARFCRLKGYETLYVCGTDEYGTATETRALEEGITPKELCDRYNKIHTDIYNWFNIAFDRFGRTSTPQHTEITQDIFLKLDKQGYITENTVDQLYCASCSRFLADRYVHGTCPSCGYDGARGDQCENCGKLLDPTELIKPRCGVCGHAPEVKTTNHLYINLPAILPKLSAWMEKAAVKGFWAKNAVQMTNGWIRDGLKERCITRDLKWGIPVPKDGYRNKVFYVWFDACIGYISISANHTAEWEKWWKNPEEVELFQFIGKDNIPFHTVIFPSSLLGSGDNWTTLHHMSSTEYLNYESGKFSKSKGVGVFGNDVMDTGIPADVWRFYIYFNRPEKQDAIFAWSDFQARVNMELIGNLANLVNRTVSFITRFYGNRVPEGAEDEVLWTRVRGMEQEVTDHLDRAELKDALKKILEISAVGNKTFQDGEPWKCRTSDPARAAALIRNLVYLVKDLSILIQPYMPETAERIFKFLGTPRLAWKDLGRTEGLEIISGGEVLFQKLEGAQMDDLRLRFAGTQKDRENAAAEKSAAAGQEPEPALSLEDAFRTKLRLTAAKITGIERHPGADKLYIETIDAGNETRQIVSGLVPYYREEELLNRTIILVGNLKPAKLKGVESRGMLLAAESEAAEALPSGSPAAGNGAHGEIVDVLFVDHALPGTRVILEGDDEGAYGEPGQIKIDEFFSIPLTVRNNVVYAGEKALVCAGKRVTSARVSGGKVG